MNIVLVMTQSLDSPSGLGRYSPLARELSHMGHTVEILALHYDWANWPRKSFVDAGVRVIYAGQMHVRKSSSRKTYFGPGQLVWVSLTSTLKLARAVTRSKADVIQLCKPQPINALAVKFGRRGRPVFCDCDDYEAQTNRFSSEWQRRVVTHFEDGVVRYAAGLTVNTRFTFERYVALGFPARRIKYVPNGVERARFTKAVNAAQLRQKWQIAESDPVIGYVGTIGLLSHPVDLLLAAFAQVVPVMPKARLLLVGGGEDFDRAQALARQLNIDQRTLFTGRVAPDEVPDYFAVSTITVDPVRDDLIARARSPLKVLESLALGVPVVTGDVGDRRELLRDGQLGLLVQPGDSDALAAGLLTLLQHPRQRTEMARAALAQRERWYWDRLAHDFAQVYNLPASR
jgi:glycosyltransferase involved in cell wall biosynthesis